MIKPNVIPPVEWPVYDPNDELIGHFNVFEFNDLRIQIAKERAYGYYAMFENEFEKRRININPNGNCDSWPNGFFDLYERQLRELIDYKFMNTSEKWQELYPYPKVLDPDGWDREHYEWSWGKQAISYDEYQRRLSLSTCVHEPITACHAGKDGECNHPNCPQIRDGEPAKSGRSCPLPDNHIEY